MHFQPLGALNQNNETKFDGVFETIADKNIVHRDAEVIFTSKVMYYYYIYVTFGLNSE